jgi:hypothetical protein
LLGKHSTACATPLVHLAVVILDVRVSQTTCLGWPRTSILLISASRVARITDVNHWHPACKY